MISLDAITKMKQNLEHLASQIESINDEHVEAYLSAFHASGIKITKISGLNRIRRDIKNAIEQGFDFGQSKRNIGAWLFNNGLPEIQDFT